MPIETKNEKHKSDEPKKIDQSINFLLSLCSFYQKMFFKSWVFYFEHNFLQARLENHSHQGLLRFV